MATTRLLSAMVATWNNVATTFTGLKFNVTDTASAAGSLLMDLQVGGASKASVAKDGTLSAQGTIISASHLRTTGGGSVQINSNTGALSFGSTADVFLARDAANTLAQRNGTAAQIFTIYNTYTDASNYERASIGWIGNQFLVTPNSAGTGAGRSMFVGTTNSASVFLGTAGAGRWEVNSSGHLRAVADNAYDIGAVGADRPRNVYIGGTITGAAFVGNAANGFNFSSRGFIVAPANGVFKLSDQADADFSRLQFGGTTNAFPAIKRNGSRAQIQLADDSGRAGLDAQDLTTATSVVAGTYVKTQSTTVAGLTAAATAGASARSFVTDANATMAAGVGTAVVGGGANKVPVYSDGTNWLIG